MSERERANQLPLPLVVENCLRRGSAHFDLRAHPLQARSKRFNLFLLLGYGRFLFLYFVVLLLDLPMLVMRRLKRTLSDIFGG